MKRRNRNILFIIALILIVVSLCHSLAYCIEKSKKATWIEPLKKATLTVGKFTYEYNSEILGYKGTFRILQNNRVLFTDKVGWAAEVSWKSEPQNLEPFQMITVNPKEPPVDLFYSEIGH